MTLTSLQDACTTIGQILVNVGRTVMLWSVWIEKNSDRICSLYFQDSGLNLNLSNGARSKVNIFLGGELPLFSTYYHSIFL